LKIGEAHRIVLSDNRKSETIGPPIVMARGTSASQYIGAPMSLPPIGNADQAQWANIFFFHVRSAITIGAGGIGAPIVLAHYKEHDCVPCASPIFHTNRLLIEH
jgi:hypothetical protein